MLVTGAYLDHQLQLLLMASLVNGVLRVTSVNKELQHLLSAPLEHGRTAQGWKQWKIVCLALEDIIAQILD